MTAKLPRQQPETFALQERIGAQMSEIAALKKALKELYNAVPFDVLRMQSGNAFLDMERVDAAKDEAAHLVGIK